MILAYDIPDLEPYINWPYFYFAWQLKQEQEQQRMRHEAEVFLHSLAGRYRAHAIFHIAQAYSEDDDIVVTFCGDDGTPRTGRIACLRQQAAGSSYMCLADFIAPQKCSSSPAPSSAPAAPADAIYHQIGLFVTSVDMGMETDFSTDPYNRMMAQLLADRLAEAAAERMHEDVRRHYWGYAPDEKLTMAQLHAERFQGIRPAVGYPSLPDTSLNFVLDRLLGMGQIGIRLTESGAMRPHASVSGLMMAHPKARYFAVGKIGTDQLRDYARRRGVPVEVMKKFLSANL